MLQRTLILSQLYTLLNPYRLPGRQMLKNPRPKQLLRINKNRLINLLWNYIEHCSIWNKYHLYFLFSPCIWSLFFLKLTFSCSYFNQLLFLEDISLHGNIQVVFKLPLGSCVTRLLVVLIGVHFQVCMFSTSFSWAHGVKRFKAHPCYHGQCKIRWFW